MWRKVKRSEQAGQIWDTFKCFVIKSNGLLGEEKGAERRVMLGMLTSEVICEYRMEAIENIGLEVEFC